jgi:hypothetical protein
MLELICFMFRCKKELAKAERHVPAPSPASGKRGSGRGGKGGRGGGAGGQEKSEAWREKVIKACPKDCHKQLRSAKGESDMSKRSNAPSVSIREPL